MNPEIMGLLQEAADWRLLSVLFQYPSEGWRERLTSVAADIRDPRLTEAAAAALIEASEGMHHSIFGPGGPVSPREASYTNGVQLGYLLSEISAFYDAFAYTPDGDEPVDHVSVEAGFIGYMHLKQAYAIACGDMEKAAIAADAASEFRREHIARMASRIAASLGSGAPSYLAAAAVILVERSGPAPVELGTFNSPAATDDEEAACGTVC